jgi:hypothetical protein
MAVKRLSLSRYTGQRQTLNAELTWLVSTDARPATRTRLSDRPDALQRERPRAAGLVSDDGEATLGRRQRRNGDSLDIPKPEFALAQSIQTTSPPRCNYTPARLIFGGYRSGGVG